MKLGRRTWILSINRQLEFGNQGDKTMPNDKQGGQATQKSGERNDQQTNDKGRQQGQQREQGQGQQEEQEERIPGGGKGNR